MRRRSVQESAIQIPDESIQIPDDETSQRTYAAQSIITGASHGLFAVINILGTDDIRALVGENKDAQIENQQQERSGRVQSSA